jgi:hypothetical protein
MSTIQENLQTIADSTAAIKRAIIDKGGEITGDITTYASAIDSLPNTEVSNEYNIDIGTTTENNVNVYNFLNGLLSTITCNGKEISYLYIADDYIRFFSLDNSAYDIYLQSDGFCARSASGGSSD